MRVRLVKQRRPAVEYDAELVSDDGTHLIVRIGRGDVWIEHYWRDRWYSVKEVFDAGGRHQGWYCDIAQPARVDGDTVISEDLELDLWVSADRAVIARLDEDETDFTPEVTAAVEELERLARAGRAPFQDRRLVFGEDPELYDRMRPSYPPALIDDLIALPGVGPAARALDIGCGTGKTAALLAARGLTGVAVDADAAMAAVARRRLATLPSWRVDVAPFESWAPADGEWPFDLVVSAQAWHWLDPNVRLPKARALLTPGGWLALFWNVPAEDHSPLRRALDEVYDRLAPGLRRTGGPKEMPPGERRSYPWRQTYSADQWVDLARTHSDHRMLPTDRLGPLLAAVHAAIDAHGGVYDHPYDCVLWLHRREDLLPGD